MSDINIGAIAEALNGKTDRNLLNLDSVGQALMDKKVEVEALLEQNGYAKFTWKLDNKVSSLIIQWGYTTTEITNLAMVYEAILGGSTSIIGQHNLSGQIAHTVLYELTNTSIRVFGEIANGPIANVPYIYVLIGR